MPKLSEAHGDRIGKSGTGNKLKILVVGDSSAAGVGVKCQKHALMGQLASQLSLNFELSWKLIAKSGQNLESILLKIDNEVSEPFDFVVIAIGVNNVTNGTSTKKWHNLLKLLYTKLNKKFNNPQIFLSSIPPMHLFKALPQPLRWIMGQKAKQLNKLSKYFCKDRLGIIFSELKINFVLENLATDQFHPSELTYKQWATTLVEQFRSTANFKT